MRYFVLALLLSVPTLAPAQDIVDTPPGDNSPTTVGAAPATLPTWTNCLVQDGIDHLDPANHFECAVVSDPSLITNHTVFLSLVGGDVVVRAVTVNTTTGLISDPSSNKKTVLFKPAAPNMLSDSTEQGELGTEPIA